MLDCFKKVLERPLFVRILAMKATITLIRKEALRVNDSRHKKLARRKRRVWDPLAGTRVDEGHPMLTASNIHYELADRIRGLKPGGIGAIHVHTFRLKTMGLLL